MKKVIASILFLFSVNVAAACPELYPNGTSLQVKNTVELCNKFYVSVFDKKRQAVVLVSERLVYKAPIGSLSRHGRFHSDKRVGNRPTVGQYANTGYDKGHLVPSDNASTLAEMQETFLLTNVVPQSPKLNRGEWKRLEGHVRSLAKKAQSDVYVVTIAVYNDNKSINGIPIPTGLWKIVFVNNEQLYFYADNLPQAKVQRKSAVDINDLLH